jgi:hypothetical protein
MVSVLLKNNFSEGDRALPPSSIRAQESAHWEASINECIGIHRVTENNMLDFCTLLKSESDLDSYLTSPAYYAFTGRNGLWIYQNQASYIPFCWHPNIPGQILIFPQRGDRNIGALANLLRQLPEPPSGLRLARIQKENFWTDFDYISYPVALAPVVEHVLDWKYPVRVLSTEKVMQMQGADFRYIRNHVRQIIRRNIQIEPITKTDGGHLRNFICKWAKGHTDKPAEVGEVSAPYQKIMEMLASPCFRLDGFVLKIDGAIQAFTLWDLSNGKAATANRFANLCNLDYRGLPEFVTRYTAERLFISGIQYLNIGGSETVGLDQFKNKFMPDYSLHLHSVDAIYGDYEIQ